ncbi:MAG: phage holin family protein [Gammaproteobacteria bacterium]
MDVSEKPVDRSDRSIPSLLSEFSQQLTTLVQKEVQLAKSEVTEKVSQLQTGAASMALGGAVLFAGLLVLLQAAVYGLQQIIAPWSPGPWLSPLIVGAVVLIIGFIMLQQGRKKLKAENITDFPRTAESLRRDKEFVEEHGRR